MDFFPLYDSSQVKIDFFPFYNHVLETSIQNIRFHIQDLFKMSTDIVLSYLTTILTLECEILCLSIFGGSLLIFMISTPKSKTQQNKAEKKIPIDSQYDKKQNFINAVKKGEVAKFEKLIDTGIDVNAKYEKNNTALIWAAKNNHAEIVRLLLDNRANVNAKNRFVIALQIRCTSIKSHFGNSTFYMASNPHVADELP